MPLDKRSAAFDASVQAAKAATPAPPERPTWTEPPRPVRSAAEQTFDELRDEEYTQWQYAKGKYSNIADAVELHPKLACDADIQVAMATIRNAQRAIEARAEEILGG